MSFIHYFSEHPKKTDIPLSCRNPFDNNPHSLAILASEQLQQHLKKSPLLSEPLFEKQNGKMFGVLVVSDDDGKIGYLSSFSGMLNQQWIVPGFVPPVFDIKRQQLFLNEGENRVIKITDKIEFLSNMPERLLAMDSLLELKRRQKIELSELKNINNKNKQQRHTKRAVIADGENELQVLQSLSLQSQQDKRELKNCKLNWDKKLLQLRQTIDKNYENDINRLIDERKQMSQQLHQKVFESYVLINKDAEQKGLIEFFDGKIPAGGTGDCAAPKLIQYAHRKKLEILALAEFWWGSSPAKGVRHHAHFYPPCRGKCFPILPFMLKGIVNEAARYETVSTKLEPEIIYEDETLLILNKPAGLLSIPGKQQQYSVLSWIKNHYPSATGALLVHRLDMATSGLLMAAKNELAHKNLQQQFINRRIKKRYVAILSKAIDDQKLTVDLPLRVDLDDRPRQVVCYEHGKAAVTHVKVISRDEHSCRVYFYPVTGRTHQLRVHAAHSAGLNAPIIGDELYGVRSGRLLLHAEKISFNHPLSGETVMFKSKTPF